MGLSYREKAVLLNANGGADISFAALGLPDLEEPSATDGEPLAFIPDDEPTGMMPAAQTEGVGKLRQVSTLLRKMRDAQVEGDSDVADALSRRLCEILRA